MSRAAVLLALLVPLVAATAEAREDVAPYIAVILQGPGPAADRAAERLRHIGPQRSGPPLRALLTHVDERVRIAASSALIVVRDPASAKALEHALEGDEDWEVRQNAALALGSVRAKSSRAALEGRLGADPHRRVRKASAVALGQLGAGLRPLVAAARKDADLEVRLAALDAARNAVDGPAGKLLRPLLEDPAELIRFAAARSLAWHGDPAATRFLTTQLRNGEPEQQRRVVAICADLPRERSVGLLELALEASDADARFSAAVALAGLERRSGLVALSRMAIDEASPSLARRAAAELERRGVAPEHVRDLAASAPPGKRP